MKGVAAFIKDQGDGNIKLTFNDVGSTLRYLRPIAIEKIH
jgi:hypothetical protein